MSASQLPALTAVAFQLVDRLDTYERDVASMIAARNDMELYQQVARHMDSMRMYASALPMVSVVWVELVIRHFELAHGMWRLQLGRITMAEMGTLHEVHRGCVGNMRRRCQQLILSQDEVGAPAAAVIAVAQWTAGAAKA